MIERFQYASASAAAEAFADALAAGLRTALAARGRATVALSGGGTPRLVFPHLAAAALDWSAVTTTLIDERWVDADDADSNERLVREFLLQGAARDAAFVGLKSPAPDPVAGRDVVEERLAALSWPLDAVYLGLGPDGHIASLFPDDPGWAGAPGYCVAVPAGDGRLARISLTPAALLDSRHIFLIVVDPDKLAVLERALRPGPVAELPVRLVLHQDRVPVSIFNRST